MSVRLYILRHGQTSSNKERLVQGHRDTSLNEQGELQAALTARRLSASAPAFTHVFSSDLRRASATAEMVVRGLPAPHPDLALDARLREYCFGLREGLPKGTTPEEARALKAAQAGVPPHELEETAETAADVQARIASFTRSCLVPLAAAEPPVVLVVSHGGWIRTFLASVGELDEVPKVPNCGLISCDLAPSSSTYGMSVSRLEGPSDEHLGEHRSPPSKTSTPPLDAALKDCGGFGDVGGFAWRSCCPHHNAQDAEAAARRQRVNDKRILAVVLVPLLMGLLFSERGPLQLITLLVVSVVALGAFDSFYRWQFWLAALAVLACVGLFYAVAWWWAPLVA